MRISALTTDTIKNYIRVDGEALQTDVLNLAIHSAKSFISDYTGLSKDELDNYEDLSLAFLVLVQDIYDNRALQSDPKTSVNATVQTILDMHRRTLL